MTKKLSLFLLGGFLLLLLGCRADEAMLPEQTEKYFQVFGKQDEASLDYAKGFRYLYENYDSIQKQKRRDYTPVSQVYSKRQGFSQKSSNAESEYIDFRFHSTAFKFDNGDVWVYYPVIKGDMVAKIAVATLIENRTQVYLRLLNPETDYYREVHQLFHTAYERHRAERNSKVSARGSSNECEVGCHEIEEVVIVEPVPIPKRGGGVLFAYNYDGMYSGGGNCGDFDNCWDGYSTGGGGGGSGSDINSDIDDGNNTDPCAKMKAVGKHTKTTELMKSLKGTTSGNAEEGYVLEAKADGSIQEYHVKGQPNEGSINFELQGKIDGFVHSHYKGLLSVFSASDIFWMAEKYKKGNIRDVNTFAMGLVTASGTQYMMVIDDPEKFVKFAEELFSGNTINETMVNAYEYIYGTVYNITPNNDIKTNEDNFVRYLEKSNTGLKIMRGDTNMNDWSSMEIDKNGQINIKKCN